MSPYYVQIVGPAGRVTYLESLGTGNFGEVEHHLLGTAYETEDEAVFASEFAAERHFAGQRVLLTVCSQEEFE